MGAAMAIRPGTLREWPALDKSDWGAGPWSDEPDQRLWMDDATGLWCAMVRGTLTGAWWGYVAIPPGHRAYRYAREDLKPERRPNESIMEYASRRGAMRRRSDSGYELLDRFVIAHGGLTYGGDGPHITLPRGAPRRLRWVGFDCGHFGDIAPAMDAMLRRIMPAEYTARKDAMRKATDGFREVYRDSAFVQAATAQLATDLNRLGARRTWRPITNPESFGQLLDTMADALRR